MIWLLRHGDAADGSPDSERPLTEKGERQSRNAGRALKKLGRRARGVPREPQGARARHGAAGLRGAGGVEVSIETALQGGPFDPRELPAGFDAVLLVGHDPDFSMAVHSLTGAQVRMKKGGLAGIAKGELIVLLRPPSSRPSPARPADPRGLRLHRHRVEHDAPARRRARRDGGLRELLAQRAFTRIGKSIGGDKLIPADKIAETAGVVASQARMAREVGRRAHRGRRHRGDPQGREPRRAGGGGRREAGVPLRVLSEEDEARLSFVGATRSLATPPRDTVAVVDVGGGSTEIAVGTVAGGVEWWASLPIGSGLLSDGYLRSDPPGADELRARAPARRGRVRGPGAAARGRGRRRGRQRHVAAAPGRRASCATTRSSARSASSRRRRPRRWRGASTWPPSGCGCCPAAS